MGTIREIHASSQDVVLDIEAELAYWRTCYTKRPFHQSGVPFEAYVDTLKFGYDAYLLYYRHDLELLLPALKERYEQRLPPELRLDWRRTQNLIKATWQRMHTCRSLADATPSAALAAHNHPPQDEPAHMQHAQIAIAS
jgi:hypothetical protein